ncbi:MAG: hypothetical protein NC433_10350 [Clostridiales bacterium]|nr:hypothetical protein [Clostridiales bacterium]
MGEKQKKTLEWLDELEEYAKEKQLSMRILDSIDECRQSVVSDNIDWNQISLQIDELLDSIGVKVLPTVVKIEESYNEVSVEMVENELRNMAQRCHTENEASLNNIENSKNIIIQNLFTKLEDITRASAHLEELKNEKSYQAFFRRIQTKYRNNVLAIIRELLQSVRNNHVQMMERIRNMFQGIKAYKYGLSNEKIYREYNTKADELCNKVQGETESLDMGEKEIENLEHKTWENVKLIVEKMEIEKKKLIRRPLTVILSVLLVGGFLALLIAAIFRAGSGDSSLSDVIEIFQIIIEIFQIIKEIITLLTAQAPAAAPAAIPGVVVVIFVVLVIVLLYKLYVFLLGQWCDRQICNECSAYLNTELADFTKNNTLLLRLNNITAGAIEEYERQYGAMLNELLAGSSFDPESTERKETNRFNEIRSSWNTIKYQ